jgi:hypothetical protein
MEKISADKVAAILTTVPGMLRSVASERDGLLKENIELKEKVASYEKNERVNRLARDAQERNIDVLGETEEEKVASIEAALGQGKDLAVLEEAVKLSSPNASIGNLVGDEISGGGNTDLEAYLRGQVD